MKSFLVILGLVLVCSCVSAQRQAKPRRQAAPQQAAPQQPPPESQKPVMD